MCRLEEWLHLPSTRITAYRRLSIDPERYLHDLDRVLCSLIVVQVKEGSSHAQRDISQPGPPLEGRIWGDAQPNARDLPPSLQGRIWGARHITEENLQSSDACPVDVEFQIATDVSSGSPETGDTDESSAQEQASHSTDSFDKSESVPKQVSYVLINRIVNREFTRVEDVQSDWGYHCFNINVTTLPGELATRTGMTVG